MEISSRAWHLRLVRSYSWDYEPVDLCHYFWKVVATIALPLIWIGALVQVIVILFDGRWLGVLLGMGVGLLVFVLIGLARALWPDRTPKPTKETSLVRSYIKARKQRYCPLIEVVED